MPSVYIPGRRYAQHFTDQQAVSILDQLLHWQRKLAVESIAFKEEQHRHKQQVAPGGQA